MNRTRFLAPAALSAALLLVSASAALACDESDLDAIRVATVDYRDVAAAEAAGYGQPTGVPLEQCIAEPGEGAMGFHWINGDLVGDTVIDPAHPEAVIYEMGVDGAMSLVAVEYVVFQAAWDEANTTPPTLLGHEMHLVAEPNRYELPAFYELHAWIWKGNPSGTFHEWNPIVACPNVEVNPGASTAP